MKSQHICKVCDNEKLVFDLLLEMGSDKYTRILKSLLKEKAPRLSNSMRKAGRERLLLFDGFEKVERQNK